MEDEVSEGFKDCEQVHSSKEWSMVVIRHSQSLPNDCSVFPPTNHENLHISPHTHQSTPPFSSASSSPSPSPSSSSSSPSSSLSQFEDDPEELFSELDEIGDDPESFSPPDSRIRLPSGVSGWLGVGLEVLHSKVLGVVSGIRNYGTGRGTVWSAAGVVMAVLVSLLYRSVRRRRFREERVNQLIILLKERDERIIQLLQQIAKMNEVLLARHRVP